MGESVITALLPLLRGGADETEQRTALGWAYRQVWRYTLGRITEITEEQLKAEPYSCCLCELAERYLARETGGQTVSRESVGSWSRSYEAEDGTENGRIVRRWLEPEGLCGRGL